MRSLKILVVGAGLGGLTAALCLRRAGFDVALFEQASELGEVGAGIQIAANAVKVFRALGIEDRLDQWGGVRPISLQGRDWKTGEVVYAMPVAEEHVAQYDAPYFHFHRADLHGLLIEAFQETAPAAVRLGAKLVGVEQTAEGVIARFADGSTAEGDLLVGADGIHSPVRAALHGPDRPRFTGMIAFRTTIPVERLPENFIERAGFNWMGPRHHFVHYYVKGGRLMNCVGVCEQDDWTVESWTVLGDIAEFRREFDGWHHKIRTMIDAADTCHKWALYDRDPLPFWTAGRITLLGDAAHPMLPFLAQGACMAIEDGYVLTRCLETEGSVEAGLAAYERARLPRTARTQLGARERGRNLHLSADEEMAARNAAFQADPDLRRRQFDWLFAHDVMAEHGALGAG